MIHLVDRESNQVVGMAKIKSIEYCLFALMNSVLMMALERSEIENSERVIQNYGKQHKMLVKDAGKLPHPEAFYFEVFTAAYGLVSQRKSPQNYQSHRTTFFDNQTKFFALALKTQEEKKSKHSGTVDFESKITFATETPVPKPKAKPA